jgi:hypothetical protein
MRKIWEMTMQNRFPMLFPRLHMAVFCEFHVKNMCKSQNMAKRGQRLGIKKQAILLVLLSFSDISTMGKMGKSPCKGSLFL